MQKTSWSNHVRKDPIEGLFRFVVIAELGQRQVCDTLQSSRV